MKTSEKTEELNAILRSGDPLNIEQLAWHCGVDPKNAPGVAKALGLQPDIGRRYPWRRIWRHIHGTEGTQLAAHLVTLKERYPSSTILAAIEDLEPALRIPLIDFATMASRLGQKPDTLAKAIREGRVVLPFSMIVLGTRKRHFRLLEVRLWIEEEICLDLPAPPAWVATCARSIATLPHDGDEAAAENVVAPIIPAEAGGTDAADTSVAAAPTADPAIKAIFGGFTNNSRNDLT